MLEGCIMLGVGAVLLCACAKPPNATLFAIGLLLALMGIACLCLHFDPLSKCENGESQLRYRRQRLQIVP